MPRSRPNFPELRCLFACLVLLGVFSSGTPARAETTSAVILWEDGFPTADTAAVSRSELASALPGANFASADQLAQALNKETRLLVLPFGSAFPEAQWNAILTFLQGAGNLLVLGGKPFTRPAYRDADSWRLRPETQAFAQKLFINEYQETLGSRTLEFQKNPDIVTLDLSAFPWNRSYSMVVRLSDEDFYQRDGSLGGIDARLTTLAWGTSQGRKLSAPVVQIDHYKNNFVGGRWVLLACELPSGAPVQLISALAQHAGAGADDFNVRPSWALFLPGEPPTFSVYWKQFRAQPQPGRLDVELSVDGNVLQKQSFPLDIRTFPFSTQITLPGDDRKGLHVLTARLFIQDRVQKLYRTGYWLRDEALLNSGPKITVNSDYFEWDGKSQLVAGTTYMASDVQRQFFMQPNPYLWDQEMAEMRAGGLNMLRTGWWSAYDQVMKESGVVREDMLRALEAYLLTARKHNFPVQFTFFAFIPEMFGGANPYLDPEAVRRQKELVAAVVQRFRNVPYVVWDLINEPSFSNPRRLWATRPNGDPFEVRAWNEWLLQKYKTSGAIAQAWQTTPFPDGAAPLPEEWEFAPKAAMRTNQGSNSLKVHDYYLFAQEKLRDWAAELKSTIRSAGANQLVTIGQDEGGGTDRLAPVFFGDAVDFTATHPWWLDDAVLWDTLVAKIANKPLLVQEAGQQRLPQINGYERRTPQDVSNLVERKVAIAGQTSAGAIQWLWHTNGFMKNDNEMVIGALREDGTEKPEAQMLRRFAQFAAATSGRLSPPEEREVVIITSQALQYSALNAFALEAQQKAVRALEYYCRVAARVVTENRLAELGSPKLAVLASPQTLSDQAWALLTKYVEAGGTLLVSGSIERDPNWQVTQRLKSLGLEARPEPLFYRQAQIELGTQTIPLSYDGQPQQFLESLATGDGKTFHELHKGKGTIFLTNFPVELASGFEPTVAVYRWALQRAGIGSPYTGTLPSPGVLIRSSALKDSLLYLFVSDSGWDELIAVKDKTTGVEFNFRLASQRARLVLMERKSKKILADFSNEK